MSDLLSEMDSSRGPNNPNRMLHNIVKLYIHFFSQHNILFVKFDLNTS